MYKRNGKTLDFVIVGPERAGTTWIYEYLTALNVCFPRKTKETYFFDLRYHKGVDWFFWHFRNCQPEDLWGEVTPSYFDDIAVPRRIFDFNREIKILTTLRNPYERSFILYLHKMRYGRVKGNFKEAIKKESRILTSSLYGTHLKRWFNVFSREQILVVYLEDLKKDSENYIRNICYFLGVNFRKREEFFNTIINPDQMAKSRLMAALGNKISHKLREYRLYDILIFAKKLGLRDLIYSGGKMPPGPRIEDFQFMSNFFEPMITELENLLNLDLSHWRYKEVVRTLEVKMCQ